MTSVRAGNETERAQHNSLSLPVQRRAGVVKERRARSRTSSAGSTDVQLLTKVRGISLIQAARDGMLDAVKVNLDKSRTEMNDIDEDGYTALHYAARYNRLAVVEVLVKAGADINVKQSSQDGVTPLHLACRYNSGDVTQYLLFRQADVNVTDAKGRTPLHYATRRGNDLVTKMLISVACCQVNAVDSDQTTPLAMAAMYGNAFTCESLVSRGADIERRDVNLMSPLMWAASEGHAGVVKVLLKAAQRRGVHSKRNYIRVIDKEGNTALHLAVQNGSFNVVKILLANEAEVNGVKNNLSTPLHLAATYGFLDIAKSLVLNGAEVESRDLEQRTPMHKAALYNKVDIMRFLHKEGASIDSKDKKNLMPLHCACWKGQLEAIEFLLSHGAQTFECDVSLKTALHWAVQYDHFNALHTLLKYGARTVIACTDKNDQTVLHYAACTGNVLVLKLLLEVGAQPGMKDQEERTALHIAAQSDSVDCVEALVHASSHETNDSDVDGRTPLLLACLQGHHQVVHLLLTLGADITKRDDEHRTGLMLAAAEGHIPVMKILLDNHAAVNDGDKMKNTALHYACFGGHVEAVQLLLEYKANVTVKNTYDQSPLDHAIDNMNSDVVTVMLKNKSTCHACMNVRDAKGKTIMDPLIAKLPDAAVIVLDHCIDRAIRDEEERSLSMTFDYQYIDPGPDDPGCTKNRYFALNSMIVHERDTLLSHPVCQNILLQKWLRFGRLFFGINLLTYVGYLVCLSLFVIITYPGKVDRVTGCFADSDTNNNTRKHTTSQPFEHGVQTRVFGALLFCFVGLFIIRDIVIFISQKWKYLFNVYNISLWVQMITTCILILPAVTGRTMCITEWRSGWIATFLAWINFIMYLRRIHVFGMYVIMFVAILGSLLKVVLVFFMFVCAFAFSFNIIARTFPVFQLGNGLFLYIIVMTLGEFELNDVILDKPFVPFDVDIRLLLGALMFLMTTVLSNLTIGIAVGDIDKVERNAYLKRTGLQVQLVYEIENNMPRFLQKRVHVKKAVIKPTDGRTCTEKMSLALYSSTGDMQFIHAHTRDKLTSRIDLLADKLRSQYSRVKTMQATLQQRSTVLQQIANKLCGDLDETTAGMQSNAAVDLPGAPVQRGHWRARAFKPIGRERLKSTVV